MSEFKKKKDDVPQPQDRSTNPQEPDQKAEPQLSKYETAYVPYTGEEYREDKTKAGETGGKGPTDEDQKASREKAEPEGEWQHETDKKPRPPISKGRQQQESGRVVRSAKSRGRGQGVQHKPSAIQVIVGLIVGFGVGFGIIYVVFHYTGLWDEFFGGGSNYGWHYEYACSYNGKAGLRGTDGQCWTCSDSSNYYESINCNRAGCGDMSSHGTCCCPYSQTTPQYGDSCSAGGHAGVIGLDGQCWYNSTSGYTESTNCFEDGCGDMNSAGVCGCRYQ